MKIKVTLWLFLAMTLICSCQKEDELFQISQSSFTDLKQDGEKITIDITATGAWTVTSSETWCSPDQTSGENNAKLTVTVGPNTSAYDRTAKLSIKGAKETQTISITQQGNRLEVSSNAFPNVSSEAGQVTIDVTSNTSWTVTSNETWCTVDQATGKNDATLTVSLTANTGQSNRTAKLSIKNNSITQTVTITQTTGVYRYQLPIVFHVLYQDPNNETQNVRKGRINEIITACNKLYSNYNRNSTDINLEFVLATKDPNGNTLSEPGVDRVKWNSPTMDCEKFMSDYNKTNKGVLWDTEKYINVVLYTFTEAEILGISHMPYTVLPDELGGLNQLSFVPTFANLQYPHCVSINNVYIYENQSVEGQSYNTMDVVATLTHELGHYVGLHHTFNEKEVGGEIITDVCEDTDYCNDTPPYNRDEYEAFLDNYTPLEGGKLSFKDLPFLMERKNCKTGEKSTPNNIMDYSFSYVNRFTPDQRTRIRYVLAHSPLLPTTKATRSLAPRREGAQEMPMQVKIRRLK